jgi:hypothetical protein
MEKIVIKFIQIASLVVFMVHLAACSDDVIRRKKGQKRQKNVEVSLPTKDTAVVWIIPAGAGAMRVSLGVFEAFEKELGTLDPIIDMVGGASSGALAGAGLTYGNPPKNTPTSLKADLGKMLRKVFPHINDLADKLVKEHGFKLDELEAIFTELNNSGTTALNLSTPADAVNSITNVVKNAAKNIGKPSIAAKLKSLAPNGILDPDLVAIVNQLSTVNRANLLANEIRQILGPSTIDDPENDKLIAVASHNRKPVFFAAPKLAEYLPGPYAVGSTPIEQGLVATAAIPRIIDAPNNISFYQQGGSGPTTISGLVDGFFAVGGFDPSRLFYEIFSKLYADKNILIIYVGNGAAVDQQFRSEQGIRRGRITQKDVQGKKITFVAIDTTIEDSRGDNLFNVSGFYANPELFELMDKAAAKATETKAYKWAVLALKAIKK